MSRKKHIEEKIAKYILGLFTLIIVVTLASVLIGIFSKGLPALSWQIISQVPKGGYYFGKEGGILNAIIGTFYLGIGASVLACIVSIPVAIFMHTYLAVHKKLLENIRIFLDVLWGVPPIVYGAFIFNIMIFMGWPSSLLAAIITVTLLISPIMIRAMDESFTQLPPTLYESSLALGFFKGEVGFKFLLRQALPGVTNAFLLAFGKGIGDTASVLFTAGYTDYIPTSLTEPAATLPLAIFFQLSSPIPEVKARAYAAAVILTILILIISISSRIISHRISKSKTA